MKPGDVVRMGTFKNRVDNDKVSAEFTFKVPRDQVAVFLLLGSEKRDGSEPLDVNQRLKDFGWTPPSESGA